MKGLKEYFDALLHGDSVLEVMMERRKETVKLAAIAVVILTIALLYLHQSSAELEITQTDPAASQAQTQDGSIGAAGASGSESADTAGANSAGSEKSVTGIGGGDGSGLPLDTDGIVYVDVGGAVKHPMLAELPSGSRVEDAIQAAGGLKKEADMTGVNRAQVLTDGEKIYIPSEGEETALSGSGSSDGSTAGGASEAAGSGTPAAAGISEGRININTADVVLLQQLTGVGPVTAQKIVDYRDQNGKFQTIEDLKNVSGIGDKTFEKMKDQVTV